MEVIYLSRKKILLGFIHTSKIQQIKCVCVCVMLCKGRVWTYRNTKDFESQISMALQQLNGIYFSGHKFCQVPIGKTEDLLR